MRTFAQLTVLQNVAVARLYGREGTASPVTARTEAEALLTMLDLHHLGAQPAFSLTLFARIRAEGLTLLIVEHNMRAIRALCDRIVVLNSGRKLAEGAPASVLADPRVVRAYLGDP